MLYIIQGAETTHNDAWHGDIPAHLPGRFELIAHWPVHCRIALDMEVVVAMGNVDEIDQSLGLQLQDRGIDLLRGEDGWIGTGPHSYPKGETAWHAGANIGQKLFQEAQPILEAATVRIPTRVQ
ncbi:hypothetical protein D9M68_673310 [compost metagenome]